MTGVISIGKCNISPSSSLLSPPLTSVGQRVPVEGRWRPPLLPQLVHRQQVADVVVEELAEQLPGLVVVLSRPASCRDTLHVTVLTSRFGKWPPLPRPRLGDEGGGSTEVMRSWSSEGWSPLITRTVEGVDSGRLEVAYCCTCREVLIAICGEYHENCIYTCDCKKKLEHSRDKFILQNTNYHHLS